MKIKAKKKFGQNFLKNEIILQKIVQTIPNNNYPIIEIGSGLGDLTKYLLQLKSVTSFEIDLDLKHLLEKKFLKEINNNRLTLINDDVLTYWSNKNLVDYEYNLVANLPYYIATHIILKALQDEQCKVLIVLIQKEVAQKFSANTKDKNFSALSVITQSVAQAKIIFDVSADNFQPAPKVNSSVIKIEKLNNKNSFPVSLGFKKFLKISFTFPRKTILKNLSNAFDKEYIVAVLKEQEIPSTHRPNQIDTLQYQLLYKRFKGHIKNEQ